MDRRARGVRRFWGCVAGLFGAMVSASVGAATITVDTLFDDADGACSLRAAIESANLDFPPEGSTCVAGNGRDVIAFSVAGVLALNERLPDILGDLDIVGPGAGELVIDAGGSGPVLTVAGAGVSISGLGLTSGSSFFGGGLWVMEGAEAAVANLDVFSNAASRGGGGVAVQGALVMRDSVVRDNVVAVDAEGLGGGGVYLSAGGALVLSGTVVADNATDGRGGGLFLSAPADPATPITLGGLDVRGNTAQAGGGIFAGASLILDDSLVTDNAASGGPAFAATGGGIHALGDVLVSGVTLIGNRATGGGESGAGGILSVGGDVSVSGGALVDNRVEAGSTGDAGGGILGGAVTLSGTTLADNAVQGGQGRAGSAVLARENMDIVASTISDNLHAGGAGQAAGAVFIAGTGASTMVNGTFSGNRGEAGAAIRLAAPGATLSVLNGTITGNHGDGGGHAGIRTAGAVTLANTIVFSNDLDCIAGAGGSFLSNGHNLDGDGSCGLAAGSDQPRSDPFLGPLAGNGGPSLTHALLAGSPAIDAGDDDLCPDEDQRGAARPDDGNLDGTAVCDIGAIEQAADDLRIDDLSVVGDDITVGEEFLIDAAAGNAGRSAVDAVVLTIDLPPEIAYVSGSSACAAVGGAVTCDLGLLDVGASREVEITLRALGGGNAVIRATVAGALAEHNADNNTAEITVSIANANPDQNGGTGAGNDVDGDTDPDPDRAVIIVDTGGGALSPWMIALLAALIWRGRTTASSCLRSRCFPGSR